VVFFVLFTLGELYILPTGLGLFARLAPPRLGATTVGAWFLIIFSGSLCAGAIGTLWSGLSHAAFFALLSVISVMAAAQLLGLDRATRRIENAPWTALHFAQPPCRKSTENAQGSAPKCTECGGLIDSLRRREYDRRGPTS
jgi:proton-dependent oligopeptide transporter, POT family